MVGAEHRTPLGVVHWFDPDMGTSQRKFRQRSRMLHQKVLVFMVDYSRNVCEAVVFTAACFLGVGKTRYDSVETKDSLGIQYMVWVRIQGPATRPLSLLIEAAFVAFRTVEEIFQGVTPSIYRW